MIKSTDREQGPIIDYPIISSEQNGGGKIAEGRFRAVRTGCTIAPENCPVNSNNICWDAIKADLRKGGELTYNRRTVYCGGTAKGMIVEKAMQHE